MTFGGYLKSFNSAWGALFGLAVGIATAAPFLGLAPPWPDENGSRATAIAIIACIVGISGGYVFRLKSRRWERRIAFSLLVAALCFTIAHAYITSLRVFEYEQIVEGQRFTRRVVVGTDLQFPKDQGKRTFELIELYGLGDTAWTHESLTNSRTSLLASYAAIFFTLTLGLGILQRHSYQVARRSKTAAG